jgi:hypothetical protein
MDYVNGAKKQPRDIDRADLLLRERTHRLMLTVWIDFISADIRCKRAGEMQQGKASATDVEALPWRRELLLGCQ